MSFPGPMAGQQSTGQFHGGHRSMQDHGFTGHQQQYQSYDQSQEQLALFSMHKPLDVKSWDDIDVIRVPVSSSEIRKSLAKLQGRKYNANEILMNLKSESARRRIDALVQEQNEELSKTDPTSEWIVAGVDVHKETIKHLIGQAKVIKSISIILKTEPASFNGHSVDDGPSDPLPHRGSFGGDPRGSFGGHPKPPVGNGPRGSFHNGPRDSFESDPRSSFEGGGHQVNHGPRHQHGNNGMHAEHQVLRGHPSMASLQSHGHGHQGPVVPADFAPPPNFAQPGPNHGAHTQGGANHGAPRGPPQHGHNVQPGPPHGQQHHGGGMQPQIVMAPPPPPMGPDMGGHHAQIIPPPPQHPGPMPGGPPEPMHGGMPGPSFDTPMQVVDSSRLKKKKSQSKSLRQEYRDLREAEIESESSGSESGSHFSSRSIEDDYRFIERARSRGRNRSQSRSRNRSARRSRSNGRIRVPKAYKVNKSHGRTRADVEIIQDHKSSSKNSSPRSAAAAPAQPIINIRIDNDNDRERERTTDRAREVYTPDHDQRRTGNPMHSPTFSQPMYSKHDRFSTQPMSRHTSIGGSDSSGSIIDGGSSVYTSDDSTFSEPIRPRMHSRTTSEVDAGPQLRSRNMPIPREEPFIPPYHDSRRQRKPHLPVNDYPPAHRPRGSLHDDYIEPHRSPAHRRPSMSARHHSGQMANPFDPRYPVAQPSRSYNEVPPSYAYKALPQQQRYIEEGRPDPFELRAMAAQLEAMEHINQSRRSGMPGRRNSMRGRRAPEVDEWAYRPFYNGYRHI